MLNIENVGTAKLEQWQESPKWAIYYIVEQYGKSSYNRTNGQTTYTLRRWALEEPTLELLKGYEYSSFADKKSFWSKMKFQSREQQKLVKREEEREKYLILTRCGVKEKEKDKINIIQAIKPCHPDQFYLYMKNLFSKERVEIEDRNKKKYKNK